MARLRWLKSPEQIQQARQQNPEFLESTVRSIRVVYETAPEIVAAVLPRPLETVDRPEVCATFSHVAMHVGPELTIEIGSAVFGVTARYEDTEGIYLLTMPMTAEPAVVGGRETYGEPKKLAEIEFTEEAGRVSSVVSRMGISYMEARGQLGEALPAREMVEYAWCYKALPSCDKERDFDGDPLLVRLEWRHKHRQVNRVDGELILRDSPFDPVADLPVERLVRMEYEVGQSESNGRVIRSVPGEWLLPFLHQRYDEPQNAGVEIAIA
jgi:acetoacetate decarboxylase